MIEIINKTKPFPSFNNATELHMLTGVNHIKYSIWALKTFLHYSNEKFNIIFHSDGTINNDLELQSHFPGCKLIVKNKIREEICSFLKKYPNLHYFRCKNNRILFQKLIDFYYFSEYKQYLAFDSDVLFLRNPKQMIENIKNCKGFYMRDIQNAYGLRINLLKKYKNVDLIPKINTGIIYMPGEKYYDINYLEYCAGILKENIETRKLGNGSWGEQTLYALMMTKFKEKYLYLSEEEYIIPKDKNDNYDKVSAVHYVTPKRSLFEHGIKYLIEKKVDEILF